MSLNMSMAVRVVEILRHVIHSSFSRLRAVPIFPLEFVEPRKDIAKTGARNPGQGKTREAKKIGTADNLLFRIKPPTFVAMSQSGHVR